MTLHFCRHEAYYDLYFKALFELKYN